MLFPYYVLQETWPVMLEVVSLGKDTAPRKIYILSSTMTFLCLNFAENINFDPFAFCSGIVWR